MKNFQRNGLKTFLGWLVGIPILELLRAVNGFMSSTILCVFYTLFYTFVDYLIADLQRARTERRLIWRKFNSGLI